MIVKNINNFKKFIYLISSRRKKGCVTEYLVADASSHS